MIVKRALILVCFIGNLFSLDSLTWEDGLTAARAAVCATAACHSFETIMNYRENSLARELNIFAAKDQKIDFGKKDAFRAWGISIVMSGIASTCSLASAQQYDSRVWAGILFGFGGYTLLKTINMQRRINKASISIDIQEKFFSDAGAKANNDTDAEEMIKDAAIAQQDQAALNVERKIFAHLGQLRKYSAATSLASLAAGACLLKLT
jgi:hypothetical protein